MIDFVILIYDEFIFFEEVVKEFFNVCLILIVENIFYVVGEEVFEIVVYDVDLVFIKVKLISLDVFCN